MESSLNELLVLSIGCHDLSIAWLGGQVDGKGDELFTHNRLWTVDDELIHEWNTLCVSECGLQLVLLGKMVKQFQDKGSEARCFQDFNELWDKSLVINLASDLSIERKIEKKSESNLQEELVVAWNEAIELVDDAALFHLSLAFAKDTQFLQEVQYDEEEVWVVSIKHGYKLRYDMSVLHLAFNL